MDCKFEQRRGREAPGRVAVLILLFAMGTVSLSAQSARQLVQQGNESYQQEQYDDALKAYEQAAEVEPDAPGVWFNKWDALYQQGEFDKAIDAYEQAALRSQDPSLEARSKFNQGNASFRGGIAKQQEDPKQALASVERGVRLYQDALKLDPKLNDARHNVEVARRVMKALIEQMQNQPQQPGDKQQDDKSEEQDPQEQLEDLINQQQQASEQSADLSEQQQSQGKSQQTQQQSQQLADQQQKLNEQTEQLADQMESQSKQGEQQQAGEQAKEHLDKAAEKQKQAEEQLRNEQAADAKQSQEEAREELEKAMQAMSGEEGEGEEQEQEQAQQQKPSPEEQQKRDEAMKDAEDILNEERANKQQRAQRAMVRIRPAEKDW